MNYYAHHIGDYARDTAHLTMLEDAAYRRMLDLYYASERPLPLNRAGLYRLVRARSKDERSAVDTVLLEYFVESESGWTNKRCDAEIAKTQGKSDAARQSAHMRWHSERNANALSPHKRAHTDGNAPNNQEPITNNQEPDKTLIPFGDMSGKPDAGKRLNGKNQYVPEAEAVLAYLNTAARRSFEFRNPAGKLTANADHVIARLSEGYSGEQLREVVLLKCEQWRGDEKMADYLRPETLFNRTKFQQYLGELSRG